MNSEISMNVSSLIRNDGEKIIYVLFTDGNKRAEINLPGPKLVKNEGFNEDEIKQLLEYTDNQNEIIYDIAKRVNPMKAFMGEKQG